MQNGSTLTPGGAFLGYRIGREDKRTDPRKYQRGPTDVPPTRHASCIKNDDPQLDFYAQHDATFGTLDLEYRQEANPQQIPRSHQGGLLGRFLVRREIPRLWVGRWYDEDLGDGGRVVEDLCNHRQRSCCG